MESSIINIVSYGRNKVSGMKRCYPGAFLPSIIFSQVKHEHP
jgi:hypothetical protein